MGGSNVLMFYVGGPLSVVVENQDPEQTKAELMERLRATYGDSIPDPIDMVMSDWNSNPLYQGGWSQNPVGFTEDDFDVLTRNEGRIYFAGEHTSRFASTMVHGAYDSGVEQACSVVTAMGLPCDNHVIALGATTLNAIFASATALILF